MNGIFCEHERDVNKSRIPVSCTEIDNDVKALEASYLKKFREQFRSDANSSHICIGIEQEKGFRNSRHFRSCNTFLPIQKNTVMFEGEPYDTIKNFQLGLEMKYGDIWNLPRTFSPCHSNEMQNFGENEASIIERIKNMSN